MKLSRLFATIVVALALLGATTSVAASATSPCSQDTLFFSQVGHLPPGVGGFRNELYGQMWRYYATQAQEAPLPAKVVPTPCNPAYFAVAASYGKAIDHAAKYRAVLATFPGRGTTANPTKAQWRLLLSEAALADVAGIAVLKAMGGENFAATNWTTRVETDRTWLIARAKAIR